MIRICTTFVRLNKNRGPICYNIFMTSKVFVYDPTANDPLSKVRGVGRYLQILRENFNEWIFTNNLSTIKQRNNKTIFLNPFFNFLQRPITMKKIAQKQIAVIHDLIPLKYPEHFPIGIKGKINIFLNKLALKSYDLIVTDSETSRKDIIRLLNVDESLVRVVYPCLPKIFNDQFLRTNFQSNPNESISNENSKIDKFCLYVGDATWNKNLVNLAKAAKLADVNCVFVGKIFQNVGANFNSPENNGRFKESPLQKFNNGWQKELKEFLELTINDKRFIFAGFIDDKELIKLYQQATVNLLPSRDEGFGFSYVEAGSQHCPSILADRPIFREISANAAVFVDLEDPQALAQKIKNFFSQPKNETFIKNTYMRSQFFNPKKFRQGWLEAVE
jgi:glycosyltransferase involved in cell wall biosynthesis